MGKAGMSGVPECRAACLHMPGHDARSGARSWRQLGKLRSWTLVFRRRVDEHLRAFSRQPPIDPPEKHC
eukprot:8076715-Pyramimonas_sp.AAC.1